MATQAAFQGRQNHSFLAKDLDIQQTKQSKFDPKKKRDLSFYKFGYNFTDHMFQVDYSTEKGGWQQPRITPYQPLEVHTTASCLHYAINHFEGLSIYKNQKDEMPQAFRAEDTLNSFYESADYLDMPLFDKEELMKCLAQLIKLEYKWFPKLEDIEMKSSLNTMGQLMSDKLKQAIGTTGIQITENAPYTHSSVDITKLKPQLYVRLVHISTYKILGIKTSQETKLYAIVNPCIIDEGDMKVKCSSNVIKAWPLGHGKVRISGNLGPLLPEVREARQQGYDDVLWLLDDYVQELTVQNIYAYWKSRFGQRELLIPKNEGTIFEGLMRKTIIDLKDEIEQETGVKVVVRDVSIHELLSAYREFRLIEMFSTTSSSKLNSISRATYKDSMMDLSGNDQYLAQYIRKKFHDITTSDVKPKFITKFKL